VQVVEFFSAMTTVIRNKRIYFFLLAVRLYVNLLLDSHNLSCMYEVNSVLMFDL